MGLLHLRRKKPRLSSGSSPQKQLQCLWVPSARERCAGAAFTHAVQQESICFQQLLPSEFRGAMIQPLISGGPTTYSIALHYLSVMIIIADVSHLALRFPVSSEALLCFFVFRAVIFILFFSCLIWLDLISLVPFLSCVARGEHVPVVYHHQGGQNCCAAPEQNDWTEAVRH